MSKHQNPKATAKDLKELQELQETRATVQETRAELLEHNNLIKLHAEDDQPLRPETSPATASFKPTLAQPAKPATQPVSEKISDTPVKRQELAQNYNHPATQQTQSLVREGVSANAQQTGQPRQGAEWPRQQAELPAAIETLPDAMMQLLNLQREMMEMAWRNWFSLLNSFANTTLAAGRGKRD